MHIDILRVLCYNKNRINQNQKGVVALFLSRSHQLYFKIMAGLQLTFGGVFGGFMLIGLISALSDSSASESDRSTGFALTIAFGCILALGILNRMRIQRANRFNSLFMGSKSGTLKLSSIAATLGMSLVQCRRSFDKSVREGLLINCHLELIGEPVVVLHAKDTGVNCLSRKKIIGMHLLAAGLIGVSGFFLFLFVFGLIRALTGGESLLEDKNTIWIGIGAVFSGVMWLGIWLREQIGKAYRFSGFFSGDPDGIIPLRTTAAVLGLPMEGLAKEFDLLVQKGYLCNCHLTAEPEPAIVLHNGARTVKERFIAVSCPNCGASNSMKVGFMGKCKYCDTYLQS